MTLLVTRGQFFFLLRWPFIQIKKPKSLKVFSIKVSQMLSNKFIIFHILNVKKCPKTTESQYLCVQYILTLQNNAIIEIKLFHQIPVVVQL